MPVSKEAQRLDDMMRKVEGLLAKADSTDSPQEADALRETAERIMVKYKIEQEDLITRGDLRIDGLNVMFEEFNAYKWSSDYGTTYHHLLSFAMHHCGVMGVWTGYDGDFRTITLIGYEADLRYAKALFMDARLHFADRMEPKYDASLSDEENVYRMRNAGMERPRIAEVMGWGRVKAQKVTTVYKRACAARGEDPLLVGKSTNVKDYRAAYATGFTNEFWKRLDLARNAIEKEIEGSGLVLHGRKERIKEAMYQRWPELRPSETPARVETKVAKAKPYRWTKADQRRWEKENNATAQMGRSQGRKAAAEININNGTPRKRLNQEG
jgi:hypothetical protein